MKTRIKHQLSELLPHEHKISLEMISEELENYLHGSCISFALAYQQLYGGELYASFTDNEAFLIHAWVYLDGIHIDASGEIQDLDNYLLHEFGDKSLKDFSYGATSKEDLLYYFSHSGLHSEVEDATSFIKKYKDFYR